jgi:hypothetical protein
MSVDHGIAAVSPKLSERARPAGDHSRKSVEKANACAVLLVFGLQKAKKQKNRHRAVD